MNNVYVKKGKSLVLMHGAKASTQGYGARTADPEEYEKNHQYYLRTRELKGSASKSSSPVLYKQSSSIKTVTKGAMPNDPKNEVEKQRMMSQYGKITDNPTAQSSSAATAQETAANTASENQTPAEAADQQITTALNGSHEDYTINVTYEIQRLLTKLKNMSPEQLEQEGYSIGLKIKMMRELNNARKQMLAAQKKAQKEAERQAKASVASASNGAVSEAPKAPGWSDLSKPDQRSILNQINEARKLIK